MTKLTIKIPDDLPFASLKLRRLRSGAVSFDRDVINRICDASNVDPSVFWDAPEDNTAGLIVAWYIKHRAAGGAPDEAAETLIREAVAEELAEAGDMLTVPAVAALVGRLPQHVARACASGHVPGAVKLGEGRRGEWKIPNTPAAIDACRARKQGRKKK